MPTYSGLHLCEEVALGFLLPLGEDQGEGRLLIQLKTAVRRSVISLQKFCERPIVTISPE
jgi:hypothetical protein